MTQSRLELDNHTLKVLDVIKGKYGLKNRSEALTKLAKDTGEKYVSQISNELVLRELDEVYETHKKENSNRTMSLEELDNLLDLE